VRGKSGIVGVFSPNWQRFIQLKFKSMHFYTCMTMMMVWKVG
jgi:hypothetical protein